MGHDENGKSGHRKSLTKQESDTMGDKIIWKYLSWDTSLEEIEQVSGHDVGTKISKFTNPTAWSSGYKMYLVALGCIANFSTTYTGGSYTSATNAMSEEWHVSRIAILVGVTVYAASFGIGPMVLASFSELNGRRPVVIVSGVAYVIGILFCAVTRLYVGMVLARILVGLASSTFGIVVVGVMADIYTESKDQYFALTFFAAGAMFGTGFGPLISAFVVQNTHWRWLFGAWDIFCAILVAVFVISFREPRGPVLLSRKAKALNDTYDEMDADLSTGSTRSPDSTKTERSRRIRWKVKEDEERRDIGQVIRTSLTRAMHLLVTEPVVFWFSLWASFAWSIMYAMLVVVPYTFQTVYGFDLQTSSATFASMCVATLIMTVVSSSFHDRIATRFVSKERLDSPEGLLYPVAIEATLLPIGLFWYGWGAQTSAHWIVPTLGLGCATMGMFSVYLAVFAYLAAAYGKYASSANAAQSLMRNLISGAFPLFSQAMFKKLGFGGACSLLGAIGAVLTLVPWILIFFGPKIRARSKFAFNEDKK